jgi:hypothetical protein
MFRLRVLLLILAFPGFLASQTQLASDSQALALAAESTASMTGGVSIRDVTLTGTVTRNSVETGTVTLRASGTDKSRVDLVFDGGPRTEIRDTWMGVPRGEWTGPNQTSGKLSFHNCQTDAVWFFPALSSLAMEKTVALLYKGHELRNGTSVEHIQSYVHDIGQSYRPTKEQLSTMDFYLDATTLRPLAVRFNVHPDNDPTVNLVNEIFFSDYHTINGVTTPMHIQRYQQGNLMLDIVLSDASLNTNLHPSIFAIQ